MRRTAARKVAAVARKVSGVLAPDYDAVIDFDEITRDPNLPTRVLPLYGSADHLHSNNAGYEAMGNAIDLKLFKNGEEG